MIQVSPRRCRRCPGWRLRRLRRLRLRPWRNRLTWRRIASAATTTLMVTQMLPRPTVSLCGWKSTAEGAEAVRTSAGVLRWPSVECVVPRRTKSRIIFRTLRTGCSSNRFTAATSAAAAEPVTLWALIVTRPITILVSIAECTRRRKRATQDLRLRIIIWSAGVLHCGAEPFRQRQRRRRRRPITIHRTIFNRRWTITLIITSELRVATAAGIRPWIDSAARPGRVWPGRFCRITRSSAAESAQRPAPSPTWGPSPGRGLRHSLRSLPLG